MLALFATTMEGFVTQKFYSQAIKPGQSQSLSLFLSSHSFQYSIFTGDYKQILELCHERYEGQAYQWNEAVLFFLQNHLLHQKKFHKVNIVVLNTEFTMIPEAFADEAEIKNTLNFVTGTAAGGVTFQHHFQNTRFCYALENELCSHLEKTFSNASIRHSGAVNLQLLFNNHSLVNCDLFLNVGDTCIEISVRDKKSILFYNVFDYETNEDILYYLLFTMEQYNLNPAFCRLRIAALRPTDDALFKSIKQYVKQVDFSVHDSSLDMKGELQQLPGHYYFSLLNQHLCEL